MWRESCTNTRSFSFRQPGICKRKGRLQFSDMTTTILKTTLLPAVLREIWPGMRWCLIVLFFNNFFLRHCIHPQSKSNLLRHDVESKVCKRECRGSTWYDPQEKTNKPPTRNSQEFLVGLFHVVIEWCQSSVLVCKLKQNTMHGSEINTRSSKKKTHPHSYRWADNDASSKLVTWIAAHRAYRRIPLPSPGLKHDHFGDLVGVYTEWAYTQASNNGSDYFIDLQRKRNRSRKKRGK